MIDKILGFIRKEAKKEVAVKWLSTEERFQIKKRGGSIKGDNVIHLFEEDVIYQEKESGYLFDTKGDLEIQFELHMRLTKKGLFPPQTEWFGYESNGKFGLSSKMPHCVDVLGLEKPYIHEGSRTRTPNIYQEILKRIDPTINIFTKKGEVGYKEGKFWFGLLTCDSWRSDNWREYQGKLYLVDFEGVESIKDNRSKVVEAVNRLRKLDR